MKEVSPLPAHALLSRRDEASSHSIRPAKTGAVSAFASYGFGPMDIDKGKDAAAKPVAGAGTGINLLSGPSTAWQTQIQA